MRGSLLGPEFDDAEIGEFLEGVGEKSEPLPPRELASRVARLLEEGNVVGWFNGRMEYGPRALGSRSIIGDARDPSMQARMNLKIKFRESFRPFAPCVLREHVSDWFKLDRESPYMLLVDEVADWRRLTVPEGAKSLWGIEKLNVPRSSVPAITHIDYSARIQTVDAARHGLFHEMMYRFWERTGCPVIVNTSFNVRGEPIVCTPADAWRCFRHTHIDALALGHHLLLKRDRSEQAGSAEYLSQFQLD
jgi:carbamoyltransferase